MEQKHHYTGLTDAQVLESRSKHGVNVLTPPEKDLYGSNSLRSLVTLSLSFC